MATENYSPEAWSQVRAAHARCSWTQASVMTEVKRPLGELGLTSLEEWRFDYKVHPHNMWTIRLPFCRVRILLVTDAGGSFGTGSFGLKAMIDALAVPPRPWVRFEVTTANRRSDPTAEIQNFSFNIPNLADFDGIWLFGVERSFSPALNDQELRALALFMDGRGGLFATGDSEKLGVAMCGAVPRVRGPIVEGGT
jgi:hypothetical protein